MIFENREVLGRVTLGGLAESTLACEANCIGCSKDNRGGGGRPQHEIWPTLFEGRTF
jgi:hypothetical protein